MVLQVISIYLHQSSKWNVVHCSAKLYIMNYILLTSLQANDIVKFQISKFSKFEVDIIFLIREMKLTEIYISLKVKSWKFIISFYIYKFLTRLNKTTYKNVYSRFLFKRSLTFELSSGSNLLHLFLILTTALKDISRYTIDCGVDISLIHYLHILYCRFWITPTPTSTSCH